MAGAGHAAVNVDCTVVAEAPRLAAHTEEMAGAWAAVLRAPVRVKANRAEGLGALGRAEGIACLAVAPGRRAASCGPGRRPGTGRATGGAGGPGGARPRRTAPGPGAASGRRGRPSGRPPGPRPGRPGTGRPPRLGGDQVEGRRAVLELLAAGRRPVRAVLMADGLEPSAQLDEIEAPGRPAPRPGRDGVPAPAGRRGPHRGPPGGAGPGPAARAESSSRIWPGRRAGRPPFLLVVVGGHRSPQPGRAPAQRRVRRGDRGRPAPSPGRPPHAHGDQGGGRGRRAPALRRGRRDPGRPRPAGRLGVWTVGLAGEAGRPCTTWRWPTARWPWWSGARSGAWPRWCASAATEVVAIPQYGACRRSTWGWPARWPASRWPASGPPAARRPGRSAPRPTSTVVHAGQRRAASGISVVHSGPGLRAGSSAGMTPGRRMRAAAGG